MFKIDQDLLRKFEGIPLLQSGHIRRASEIRSPEKIGLEDLQKLWQLGFYLCEANPTILMVALTQFSEEFFRLVNADPNLSRVVYVSHKDELRKDFPDGISGGLLINPQIKKQSGKFLNPENCGSIRQGRISMLVCRYAEISAETLLWRPEEPSNNGRPSKIRLNLKCEQGAMLQHEIAHLNGKDATDEPKLIVDFSDSNSIIRMGLDGSYVSKFLVRFRKNSAEIDLIGGHSFLVNRGGKLIETDGQGNRLRDFKP